MKNNHKLCKNFKCNRRIESKILPDFIDFLCRWIKYSLCRKKL